MVLDFSHQDLRGRSFAGQDLSNADFSHSDIRGADFSRATLIGASFQHAVIGMRSPWLFLLTSIGLLVLMITLPIATDWVVNLGEVRPLSLLDNLSRMEDKGKILLNLMASLTIFFGLILSISVRGLLMKPPRNKQTCRHKEEILVLSLGLIANVIAIVVFLLTYEAELSVAAIYQGGGSWSERLVLSASEGIYLGLLGLLIGRSFLSCMKSRNSTYKRLALLLSSLGILAGSLLGYYLFISHSIYDRRAILLLVSPLAFLLVVPPFLLSSFYESLDKLCHSDFSSNTLYCLTIYYPLRLYISIFPVLSKVLGFIIGYLIYRTPRMQQVLQKYLIILPFAFFLLFLNLNLGARSFFVFSRLEELEQPQIQTYMFMLIKIIFIPSIQIILLLLCSLSFFWTTESTNFYKSNLTEVDFSGATLGTANFSRATFER